MEITIGLALIAGFVSFISPCVLPLVPAYIGYMGGQMTHAVASETRTQQGVSPAGLAVRLHTATHGLFFVAGFSLVFITIGLLSTAFIQQVGGNNINLITGLIGRLGGMLIIVFGLHFMGVIPGLFRRVRAHQDRLDHPVVPLVLGAISTLLIVWGLTGSIALWTSPASPFLSVLSLVLAAVLWLWLVAQNAFAEPGAFVLRTLDRIETALYSDTRRQFDAKRNNNYLNSTAMGVVFSAGWTPCIGPVYGAVLTMAASGGDVGQAGVLLGMYSLGLGIPFLLTALLLDGAQGWLRRAQRHMRSIELASGVFLVVIGLAVTTGQLQNLSERFADDFAEFSIRIEEQVLDFVVGPTAEPDTSATDTPAVESATAAREDARQVGLDVGQFAPDFETTTHDGQAISLSDLQGDVVLLNFWATWCGPCRVEMPAFQEQFEQYADQGFTILAVNNGEAPEVVDRFRQDFDLTFPLAMDQRTLIQRQFAIFSYPSTFLIDRDGRIVARHFGPLTASQIDQLLADAGFFS